MSPADLVSQLLSVSRHQQVGSMYLFKNPNSLKSLHDMQYTMIMHHKNETNKTIQLNI